MSKWSEWSRARRELAARSMAALLAASSLSAVTAPARADAPPTVDAEAIARTLFERGKEMWQAGRYREAAELFTASNQQAERAGTLLLLGDCFDRLGKLRSAREHFERATLAARREGDPTLEARARTREAAVAPRVPLLELRIAQPVPPGLLVTLNGTEVPPEWHERPMPFDAGDYQLEAHAPGYRSVQARLELDNQLVRPGVPRVVRIALEPAAPASITPVSTTASSTTALGTAALEPTAPSTGGSYGAQPLGAPAPASTAADTRRDVAWWLSGAGALALATGAVFMLAALDKDAESQDYCGASVGAAGADPNACSVKGVSLRNQARAFATVATLGGVFGVSALGAGITLFVISNNADAAPSGAGVRWRAVF